MILHLAGDESRLHWVILVINISESLSPQVRESLSTGSETLPLRGAIALFCLGI